MTGEEATLAVVDALESLGVPYILVGSLSTNYYGIARSTRDADFVIQLAGKTLCDVATRLGSHFRLDPQMTFEAVTMTTRHRLEVEGTSFTIELFHLSDDPHDQERFGRRRQEMVLGRKVWLPTVEDVVITKLRWAAQSRRGKDRDDAQAVIAVQGDAIDWDYVYAWCDRHGTRMLLDEIRQSIPPI